MADDDPVFARLANALQPQQKTALLASWKKAGGDNGRYNEKLLQQTFEKYSHKDANVAMIFNKAAATKGFATGADESIMTMSDHAMKLTELIDVIIRKLNNEPVPPRKRQMCTIQQIGQHHAHLKQHGLNRSLWDLLGQVLAGKLANQQMIRGQRQTQRAWMTFVAVFMDQIVSGFERGLQLSKYTPIDRLEKALNQATYVKLGVDKWKSQKLGSQEPTCSNILDPQQNEKRRKSEPNFDRSRSPRPSVSAAVPKSTKTTKPSNPFVSHPHIAQALTKPKTGSASGGKPKRRQQRAASSADIRQDTAELPNRIYAKATGAKSARPNPDRQMSLDASNKTASAGFKKFASKFRGNLILKLRRNSQEKNMSASASDLTALTPMSTGSNMTTPAATPDAWMPLETPPPMKRIVTLGGGPVCRKRSSSIGDVENLRRQLTNQSFEFDRLERAESKEYEV